jgi:hypothetical protein
MNQHSCVVGYPILYHPYCFYLDVSPWNPYFFIFSVEIRKASKDHAITSPIFTRQSLYVREQFLTARTNRVSKVDWEADKIGSREYNSNFLAASAPSPYSRRGIAFEKFPSNSGKLGFKSQPALFQ